MHLWGGLLYKKHCIGGQALITEKELIRNRALNQTFLLICIDIWLGLGLCKQVIRIFQIKVLTAIHCRHKLLIETIFPWINDQIWGIFVPMPDRPQLSSKYFAI